MPPRPSPKKLPTKTPSKKTLDSKNPPITATQTPNPRKSDPPTATNIESAENAVETVSTDAREKSEPGVVREEIGGEENEGRGEGEREESERIRQAQVPVNERRKQKEYRQVQVPVNERRKPKEYEVFVGGLDRDAVEEDLEKVFKKFGDIVEVRLVKRPYSQKNKGFAFVRFATVEQAKKAAAVRFTKVKGKLCEVTRNNDNETLHLRNICTTWTQDELVEKLKVYELENLEEVHLIDDPNNRGKNRGYAFLGFSTHMDAVTACTKLQKRGIFFGTDTRAEVAFAKSAVEPDEEVMAQVRSVFLDGLPTTWDEEYVREQFKKYGEIEKVELARNMPTAKRKDFGFICFQTREAALACIDEVNKGCIVDETENVVLKATLRKPLMKRTIPTMGGRRGGFIGKSQGGRLLRPYGIGHSYSGRPSRTQELMGRDHSTRFSGLDRYSAREDYSARDDEFRSLSPPIEKYARDRKEVVRRAPAPTVTDRRVRDLYLEGSSSGRRSLGEYREISASYSQYSSHELYDDDDYGSQYEYYEDYDYPVSSGSKRPYSALDDDDDLVVYSYRTRRARRGSDLEIDDYPQRSASTYDDYSWVLPDDHFDHNRAGYANETYGRRHMSGSSTSRSYY